MLEAMKKMWKLLEGMKILELSILVLVLCILVTGVCDLTKLVAGFCSVFEALFLKIELGIIIGGGYKIMKLLERVEVSVDGAFFKLQMLEKRLEHLVEPGAEAARHIQQIIVDLSGPKHQ